MAGWTALKPLNGQQKSFYGKAQVIELCGIVYLKSYETIVCSYNKRHGIISRHWSGMKNKPCTKATWNHIKAFLDYCGSVPVNKSDWCKMPVLPNDFLVNEILEYNKLTA